MKTFMFTFTITITLQSLSLLHQPLPCCEAKLADRCRLVQYRKERSAVTHTMNSCVYGTNTIPSRRSPELPIEGPKYRGKQRWDAFESNQMRMKVKTDADADSATAQSSSKLRGSNGKEDTMDPTEFERQLGSQLTGCCLTYSSYSADNLCYKYGKNCNTGAEPSHNSGNGDCFVEGLSFIGISFSVNTVNGNPYSYQLCGQIYMENIVHRDYDYVMSMVGWREV